MLLWKRYGNNKMAVMCYYGSVFYIFNSTVIDWTCFIFISPLLYHQSILDYKHMCVDSRQWQYKT